MDLLTDIFASYLHVLIVQEQLLPQLQMSDPAQKTFISFAVFHKLCCTLSRVLESLLS